MGSPPVPFAVQRTPLLLPAASLPDQRIGKGHLSPLALKNSSHRQETRGLYTLHRRARIVTRNPNDYNEERDRGSSRWFENPGMKAAIVTLVVGSVYRSRWEAHCARGWRQYADKHGFELLVIDRPLDETSARPPVRPHGKNV